MRRLETTVRRRVLVTGGAGFLGSHLCERLHLEGHEVLCMDNFVTGQLSNIAHLIGRPGFELIEHDVALPFHLQVDEIYNLACPASPVHYQTDPIRTVRTCIQGALNVLSLAQQLNARVLQASTSEVYGDPEVHPQTESYRGSVNPTGPRACYDEGKRCAETLFFDYHRHYGTTVKVARIFNTYGPRMHPNDGRVVSNFIVQALLDRPITVYGNGDQTRSFCYVDDLIEGLIRLMRSGETLTGPVNLGNPGEFTVLELAHMVIELTGSRSAIRFLPLPEDDPVRRRPEISLGRERLGWQPKVALREGLQKTILYFEELLRAQQLEEAALATVVGAVPVTTKSSAGAGL